MPENNLPSAKPDPDAAPGEFDFAAPITERPRVKRRALQQATTPKMIEINPEKPAPTETRASAPKTAASSAATRSTAAKPVPSPTASGEATARTKTTPSTQTTSPHGTRPATLYYSSSPRQDKETTPPMKTTPAAASPSPTTSTSVPSATATRTTSPAATTRPASAVDYRANVERQSREQKSVGGILSILVYTLIAFFVLGAGLAGYGAYVVHQALHDQSVTVGQLEARYDAENKDLNARLATTLDTLSSAQAQIGREQDLIVKQQDTINKLLAATQDNASAIKAEKAARAQETANIRARVRDLENQGTTTHRY